MVTMQQLDSDHEKDTIFCKLVNSVKTFHRQNVDIYARILKAHSHSMNGGSVYDLSTLIAVLEWLES